MKTNTKITVLTIIYIVAFGMAISISWVTNWRIGLALLLLYIALASETAISLYKAERKIISQAREAIKELLAGITVTVIQKEKPANKEGGDK
jgi:ABC-type multidrug transport system fused ATPase/permease subunit